MRFFGFAAKQCKNTVPKPPNLGCSIGRNKVCVAPVFCFYFLNFYVYFLFLKIHFSIFWRRKYSGKEEKKPSKSRSRICINSSRCVKFDDTAFSARCEDPIRKYAKTLCKFNVFPIGLSIRNSQNFRCASWRKHQSESFKNLDCKFNLQSVIHSPRERCQTFQFSISRDCSTLSGQIASKTVRNGL